MSGGFTYGAYAQLGTANQAINAASSVVFGTVDNAAKVASMISVTLQYDGAATNGATVQIEQNVDDTNFESEDSSPWPVPMPFAQGAIKDKVFTVPADQVGKFRVRVVNEDQNVGITNVNVRVAQATSV